MAKLFAILAIVTVLFGTQVVAAKTYYQFAPANQNEGSGG